MSDQVYSSADTVEEDFVNLVNLELNDIKHTFFKIGFRLREANDFKYYKKLGYESIVECAEALFGFKKSTTYDLINISLLFKSDGMPMKIDPYYDKFSQSQLVALSAFEPYERRLVCKICTSNDTVADIRKIQ